MTRDGGEKVFGTSSLPAAQTAYSQTGRVDVDGDNSVIHDKSPVN